MTKNLEFTLVNCLLSQLYALECAREPDLNEDFAVGLMEQVGATLQSLSSNEIRSFLAHAEALAADEADEERKAFLLEFGENFGLSDFTA